MWLLGLILSILALHAVCIVVEDIYTHLPKQLELKRIDDERNRAWDELVAKDKQLAAEQAIAEEQARLELDKEIRLYAARETLDAAREKMRKTSVFSEVG